MVKPPGILVEMGSIPKGSYFVPRRAVYGFRRSPKLWGEHRDQTLETLEVEVEGGVGGPLILQPMESEPNLWRVMKKEQDLRERPEVLGLVMTYVDDMFIVGRDEVVGAVIKKLRACWKTSEPEEVGRERAVRFLGMEVITEENEESGFEDWIVCQTSYIQDLTSRT